MLNINLNENYNYAIYLIGTGATGSQLLPFLTQLLNNLKEKISLTLIDGDIIENKNLKNQKFLKQDIGNFKSSVLCERYQRVYPNLDISYFDTYLKDYSNLLNKFEYCYDYCPIIIGTVDNNSTRKILNDVFEKHYKNIIYIDSGNGTLNRSGQIVVGYKEKGKEILFPVAKAFPEILEDTEDINKVLSCSYSSGEHPQNIATNIMAASTLFNILTNILMFNKITSHVTFFNADNNSIVTR